MLLLETPKNLRIKFSYIFFFKKEFSYKIDCILKVTNSLKKKKYYYIVWKSNRWIAYFLHS